METLPALSPLDLDGFERMFGSAAARHRPTSYQLMLLGPSGGLDIRLTFDDMLGCARQVSHHEEPFGWLGMSRDPAAIHSTLLDCLLHECCRLGSARLAPLRPIHAPRAPSDPGATIAFALLAEDPQSLERARAARARIGELAPAAIALDIDPKLARSLARALKGAQRSEHAAIIGAAREAIEIGAHARRAPSVASARL